MENYDNFQKFLREHQVSKNDKKTVCTHTAYTGGKYHIPNKKMDQFNVLYVKALRDGKALSLIERPMVDAGPLVIDIDWNLKLKYKKRRYTLNDIKYIIKSTNDIIQKYYDIDDDKILKTLVTEKPKPSVEKKKIKDGFHVYYPCLPIPSDMRELILKELAKHIAKEKPFKNIPYTNPETDVIDPRVAISNGMTMYGSKKNNGQLYKLTNVFNSKLQKLKLAKYTTRRIIKELSNRKFHDTEPLELRDTISLKDLNKAKKSVGIEVKYASLSIDTDSDYSEDSDSDDENVIEIDEDSDEDTRENYSSEDEDEDENEDENEYEDDKKRKKKRNKTNKEISKKIEKMQEYNENQGINSEYFTDEEKYKKDINLAKKLIAILSAERSSEGETWMHVCWALRNICNEDELYKDFVKFSKKTTKGNYDKKACEKYWNQATEWKNNKSTKSKLGYTILSLKLWAAKDNPKKCREIIRKSMDELFRQADSGNDFDLAELVHGLYYDRYVCSDIEKTEWYEFKPKKHRWVKCPKAYTLKTKLSKEIVKEYARLIGDYVSELQCDIEGDISSGKLDANQKNVNNLYKIIRTLKKHNSKESIIKECANLFYDPDFSEKLNANKYLIGFENGIYDLRDGTFRDGTPDDYVTFSTGYDYKTYSLKSKIVTEMLESFRKAQTEEVMYDFVLTFLASFLDGKVVERFDIWTGVGANSKSKTVELFQKAFGDYCATLPSTVFTSKRPKAGQATPEFACLPGKRFVVLNEPESTEQVYVGVMKQFTGGDKVQARELYKGMMEFHPQCKFLMVCNILPNIAAEGDGGTWRRIKVTPWESQFVHVDENGLYKGKPLGPRQFPRDDNLDEKYEIWKSALMYVLLKVYYPKYVKNGIPEPAKVNAKTNEYQEQNDGFLAFLNESLDITGDTGDSEPFKNVYRQFKEWFKEYYPATKIPPAKEFKDYINKDKRIKFRNNTLIGLKLKPLEYDEEDEEEEEEDENDK